VGDKESTMKSYLTRATGPQDKYQSNPNGKKQTETRVMECTLEKSPDTKYKRQGGG
jgi:hypothetical protein